MEGYLFQKTGVAIGQLALDLLSRNEGERIPTVSEYQEKFGVSRGTIQNAFKYLKDNGAVSIGYHGHLGAYIETIHYGKLQSCCIRKELLGIMPLPYSTTYEGFAAAIYMELEKLNFNMAYSRGAGGRIRLVESGTYQFAVVSQYAAEYSIENGSDIEVVLNFGPGSFLSRHVLLLRDTTKEGICDGMRVSYDSASLDQSRITKNITKGKQVELVNIKTQNTVSSLLDGTIDAGIWNYDDIIDNKYRQLKVVRLTDEVYNDKFSTAVIVIKKGDEYMRALLEKYINIPSVLNILKEVREGKRLADY